MSMAKRKRDILTLREVVPNRFDGQEGANGRSEEGSTSTAAEGVQSTGPVTGYGAEATGTVPTNVHVDSPTRQAANTEYRSHWATSAATGETSPWAGMVTKSATAGKEAQSDNTWAAEVEGWLAAVKTPRAEGSASPVGVPAEGPVERHNQPVDAFWALLKQAGYEEV